MRMNLRSGQNNLSRHKDEQDDLWLDHSVDQAWKQFRLILECQQRKQKTPLNDTLL